MFSIKHFVYLAAMAALVCTVPQLKAAVEDKNVDVPASQPASGPATTQPADKFAKGDLVFTAAVVSVAVREETGTILNPNQNTIFVTFKDMVISKGKQPDAGAAFTYAPQAATLNTLKPDASVKVAAVRSKNSDVIWEIVALDVLTPASQPATQPAVNPGPLNGPNTGPRLPVMPKPPTVQANPLGLAPAKELALDAGDGTPGVPVPGPVVPGAPPLRPGGLNPGGETDLPTPTPEPKDAATIAKEFVEKAKNASMVFTATIESVKIVAQTHSIPPSTLIEVAFKDAKAIKGDAPKASKFNHSYRGELGGQFAQGKDIVIAADAVGDNLTVLATAEATADVVAAIRQALGGTTSQPATGPATKPATSQPTDAEKLESMKMAEVLLTATVEKVVARGATRSLPPHYMYTITVKDPQMLKGEKPSSLEMFYTTDNPEEPGLKASEKVILLMRTRLGMTGLWKLLPATEANLKLAKQAGDAASQPAGTIRPMPVDLNKPVLNRAGGATPGESGNFSLAAAGTAAAIASPALAPATEPSTAPATQTADAVNLLAQAPVVFVGKIKTAKMGPTAMSYPPIWSVSMTFEDLTMLRGDKPGDVTFSYQEHGLEQPKFNPGDKFILAVRYLEGRPMVTALIGATDANVAAAKALCQLPVGWTIEKGKAVSPWAMLGDKAWPTIGPTLNATQSCSKCNRPAAMCGSGILFTVEKVIPANVQPYKNPYGDGEFTLTVKNTTDKDIEVPALISDGNSEDWANSLVILDWEGKAYLLPKAGGQLKDPRPTKIAAGKSVSTKINTLALKGFPWPNGGNRVMFTFCLGDLAVCDFFYFHKDHHTQLIPKE